MKIKEIIPIIDDIVGVYNKNRSLILIGFGETDVDKIVELVHTLKKLFKKDDIRIR